MSGHEHKFVPVGVRYFKQAAPPQCGVDQTVSYQRLFCEKCGETKEIICDDHRRGAESGGERK